MKPKTKALRLAKKMGIRIKPVTPIIREKGSFKPPENEKIIGAWHNGKTIYIGPHANTYTILHEIGHVINGWMCCTEHCEYAAHGAAMVLAKIHNIKLPRGSRTKIDVYAGRTKSCPAVDANKPKRKKK